MHELLGGGDHDVTAELERLLRQAVEAQKSKLPGQMVKVLYKLTMSNTTCMPEMIIPVPCCTFRGTKCTNCQQICLSYRTG